MTQKVLVYMLFGFALGCSGDDSATNEVEIRDSVLDAQIEAIDKARSVDQQIQDAAEKQRQAIDSQSR